MKDILLYRPHKVGLLRRIWSVFRQGTDTFRPFVHDFRQQGPGDRCLHIANPSFSIMVSQQPPHVGDFIISGNHNCSADKRLWALRITDVSGGLLKGMPYVLEWEYLFVFNMDADEALPSVADIKQAMKTAKAEAA